jgi:quercetin dioxygenase-like cupin family protein
MEKTIKPYQEEITASVTERIFSPDIAQEELVWHRDERDRIVTITDDTDWQFQFDNQLPINLYKGVVLFIKAGEYHRVIKGTTTLKITIKE